MIALVTGASRGVGKGVALALADTGATVYVTGRTTVDETAAAVTARGGRGVAVRVDHTDDAATDAAIDGIGPLDLVVANAWGGYADHDHRVFGAPFWEQPLSRWQTMFEAGLRVQLTTTRASARVMVAQGRGVIVATGGWDDAGEYLGNLYYDVCKAAVSRLVSGLAHELRPHGVAVVGVYPGFTRTEAVVDAFAAAGLEPPPETHSPEYVGRAVAALAADPGVLELSGSGEQASTWAARYGFADVDGRTFEPFRMPPENLLRATPRAR